MVDPIHGGDTRQLVLHVVTQREPAGAQRVAHQLCQTLRARGVDGDVVFLYRRADAFSEEGYTDLQRDRPGVVGTVGLVVKLHRLLRERRPTAVVAHTFHANVITAIAATIARVPRRMAVHHVIASFESPLRRLVLRLLRRTPLIDTHVYVSHTTLDSYGPRAVRKAVVIHNGIDPRVARSGAPTWSRDPRAGAERPLVLAVGRLAPQKDHRTLLAAMRELPEAQLAIVGDGDLRGELEEIITSEGLADRVALVGNIPPAEVIDALGAADVVVQPSVWEAFSMVVLEAMAAGKAMVVSDIAAHREALGEHAVFHRVGDASELARGIRSLLDDPVRRSELGAGAQGAADAFDHDAVAQRYLELVGASLPIGGSV